MRSPTVTRRVEYYGVLKVLRRCPRFIARFAIVARRSASLREPRARHDEGLDGGARELGENERRTVHCTVVIPKRLQLRALCACRDETIGIETIGNGQKTSRPRFARARGRLKNRKTKPFRFSLASILRSLRQNKTRQRRSSDILKLYRYFSSSRDARTRTKGGAAANDDARGKGTKKKDDFLTTTTHPARRAAVAPAT